MIDNKLVRTPKVHNICEVVILYRTEEFNIHDNIKNASLIFCTQIAEKVKQPEYIPFFEVYTFELIGRYFGLTEKRINNAYKSNRGMLTNDCTLLTGPQILPRARNVRSLGKSYGHFCEFPNGVVAQIAYGYNTVLNSRALMHFAVDLRKESTVAEEIYNLLKKDECECRRELRRMKPWFLTHPSEPEHAVAASDNHAQAICPYLENLSAEGTSLKDKPPVKAQYRTVQNPSYSQTRECLQLDEHGNIIHKWRSITEAANVLGISPTNVYRCCAGITKTTGNGRGKPGKYRFTYAN